MLSHPATRGCRQCAPIAPGFRPRFLQGPKKENPDGGSAKRPKQAPMSHDSLHTTKHSHILYARAVQVCFKISWQIWALNRVYYLHFSSNPSVCLFVYQDGGGDDTLKQKLLRQHHGKYLIKISIQISRSLRTNYTHNNNTKYIFLE